MILSLLRVHSAVVRQGALAAMLASGVVAMLTVAAPA